MARSTAAASGCLGSIPERKPSYIARELWYAPSPSIMTGLKSRARTARTTDIDKYNITCVLGASALSSLPVLDAIEADDTLNGDLRSASRGTVAAGPIPGISSAGDD